MRGKTPDPSAFARAAQGLRALPHGAEIDTVVLACTHFPLVEAELAEAFGPGVSFIHGAKGIARRIADLTSSQPFAPASPGLALFTGSGDDAKALAPALRRHGLERIEVF